MLTSEDNRGSTLARARSFLMAAGLVLLSMACGQRPNQQSLPISEVLAKNSEESRQLPRDLLVTVPGELKFVRVDRGYNLLVGKFAVEVYSFTSEMKDSQRRPLVSYTLSPRDYVTEGAAVAMCSFTHNPENGTPQFKVEYLTREDKRIFEFHIIN